jgi:hypothetical protein
MAILRGLLESRAMTSAHIAKIYFDGRREAVKKRLQRLKAASLVCGQRRRPSDPAILSITRKGLAVLRDYGVLAEYPPLHLSKLEKRARVSDLTLRHELQVMDLKAAFSSAISDKDEYSLAEFCTWPLLHQFEAVRSGYERAEVLVKPDGFIRIHESEPDGGLSEHSFFLEVDRSSESLDTLVSRASCYLNYYRSGGFAVKNGNAPSAFRDFPFRVLMVFKSAERRNNTAERLLQSRPPIFTQVWLSTIDEVTSEPLGAIWIQPLDYREALSGTAFEHMQRQNQWGYQRRTAREILIESKVKKLPLMAA